MKSFIKTVLAVKVGIVVCGLVLDQMSRTTDGGVLSNIAKRIANGFGDFDNNNGV